MARWLTRRRVIVVTALGIAALALGVLVPLVETAPSADAATVTLTPVADTTVSSATPATTAGSATTLTVDGSPVTQVFVRFDLTGVTGTVQSAKLRLRVDAAKDAGSVAGGTIATSSNVAWPEATTSWNTRPPVDGPTLATMGAVARTKWVESTVTGGVTAGQSVTFAITSGNADAAIYDSRETGSAPQLVLTTQAPTTTSSSTTTTSTTTTTTTTLPPTTTTTTAPPAGDVIAAAGDAVCPPSGAVTTTTCRQKTVSDLVVNDPSIVAFLPLGDLQYDNGELTNFQTAYDPSYGRFKAITKPAPGNHEYNTANATGYYTYFGSIAGDPTKGYYSYDIGTQWHLVALNSNCSVVSCAAGSPQEQWLRADLAASTRPCTIAYWHHPRWSSGSDHGNDATVAAFWNALQADGAELVLNGHSHVYERFAPQLPSEVADPNGIRQITSGTGGKNMTGFTTPVANSEVRFTGFGVLKLTLGNGVYSWKWVNEAGVVGDQGTGSCH